MTTTAMTVRKLTSGDADAWSQVGDGQIHVSDLVDSATAPGAEMTVGFARVGKGEALDISFPYDEVLVVTRGTYTVRPEGDEPVTVQAGEVLYLPAGSRCASFADQDTEMVYVAAPPAVYAAHVAASAG